MSSNSNKKAMKIKIVWVENFTLLVWKNQMGALEELYT